MTRPDFSQLDFEGFRQLAKSNDLSPFEKIGFPDSYRKDHEPLIFDDCKSKLKNLLKPKQIVLDIGPGCSELPVMLIDLCKTMGHKLVLVDSKEMLDYLPDHDFIEKVSGRFPEETADLLKRYTEKTDVILCYSVFHYIYAESNPFFFLDKAFALLKHGGEFLLGDIPNHSKRQRFFSSEAGIAFHKEFMKTDQPPEIDFMSIPAEKIDDGILFGMMQRARNAGLESFLMPQPEKLPMANRREDLLFIRQ
jgi:2-polyprenyl-3-methyl-5-hydroxy-6-metoxy-1,4-benzoquinol methylase